MIKRWGARRVVLLVAGLALLLCCGGTLIWYAVDTGLRAAGALPTYTPSPTDAPQPTATVKPTRTSRPTATERPSATPRPPTNTPLPPTATAEPTITSLPTATVETSYTDSILPILGNYRDALNTIGGLFSDAGTDAGLIATNDWRIKVAGRLAVIQFSGDEIRALTPPAQYAVVHAELLDAANHLDSMANLSAQGIDDFDADKLTQAVDEMNQGNEAIKRALAAMPTAAGTPEAAVPATDVPVRAATVSVGAASVFTCPGGCAVAPDASCSIKGNVNSDGERIYHMPGWRDYSKVKMRSAEGDVWFCITDEALSAGFRPAQQ